MNMLLFQLGQLGRAIKRVTAAVWQTLVTWTGTLDSTGWQGYTVRMLIPAVYTPATASSLRLTLSASSAANCVITDVFIGIGKTSAPTYAFATTPTRVTFSGSNGVTIATGGTVVSDVITLAVVDADTLVVSAAFSGAVASAVRGRNPAGFTLEAYFKLGSDASTVAATGYTGPGGNNLVLFSKVEYLP